MRTQRGGNGNFRDRLANFRRQPPVGQDCSSTDLSPPSFNGAVYYTFAAYLLVATVTLSDEKLFVANTGISLPIISLVVPFLGFFVLAPLFLIILHAHVLGSLKARSTHSQRSIEKSTKITEGRRYIESAICFLFSPIVIAVVFWRLADYQSFSLSGFHFLLLALNLTLSLSVAKSLDRNLSRPITRLAVGMAVVILVKAFVCWDVFIRPWPSSIARELIFEKDHFVNDDGVVSDPLGLIPNITIDRTKLLFDIDSDQLQEIAVLHGYEHWRDYFDDKGVSIDVRGRSLRLSYLHGQTMPRLWGHDVQLQGSNLSLAYMPSSVLVNANLQDADLWLANLSGSFLDQSNLRDTYMVMTSLRGATLEKAQFQGAHIRQADFTGAWMPEVEFQLAAILGANFGGVYMENAKFWGVMYAGQPHFVASQIKNIQMFDVSSPSDAQIRSWQISSPVKNVDDYGGGQNLPPFVTSDEQSSELWINAFCTDPIGRGTRAAVKHIFLTYSLIEHPIMKMFSDKLKNSEKCKLVHAAIAGERA